MMLQKEIQKKYPCEFCHKRFPTPSKLQRHKLVHSGEKPYMCKICCKGFTQKVHLNTHRKLSHPDLFPAAHLPTNLSHLVEDKLTAAAEEQVPAAGYDDVMVDQPPGLKVLAGPPAEVSSDGELYIHTEAE